MKLVLTSLVTALVLAGASCVLPRATPGPQIGAPRKMEGETGRETHKIPGAEYIHKARVAYAKYRDLVYRQEQRGNPLVRKTDLIMPEEVIEEKKREHLRTAEENLRKVLKLNPDSAMAHHVLGLIHLDKEEYDEAQIQFTEVLRIDPLAENAWVNIAHVHWRRKDAPKAKGAVAQALKINPENRAAVALRDMIEFEEKKNAAGKAQEDVPPFRPKPDR